MKFAKTKTMAITMVILMLTMTIPLLALPTANAHTPPWNLLTWAYLTVNPNPVGIGQTVAVSMWVDKPMPEATQPNDIKRHGYQLTITKPDQTTEVQTFPYISDSTGVQSYSFVPDQIGNYSFVFYYPGEVYTWAATAAQRVFTNDTYLPATSKTVTLTVQQDQLPKPITSYPLPEEYWTRPIEGQNTDWYKIGSNFLGTASPQIVANYVTTEGGAPNTPHIMWNKQLERGEGGVVGSGSSDIQGETFYGGLSYEGRFSNPIIMAGTLYYDIPVGNKPANGIVRAVDLYTGAEIWTRNFNSTAVTNSRPFYVFQSGYLYAYDMYNQHGIIPQGLLINLEKGLGSTNLYGTTWRVFNPATGDWMFNVTNVPQLSIVLSGGAPSTGGYEILGPSGEHLRYQWNIQNGWLAEWNSSKVFNVQISGVINANTTNSFDWNVTIPKTIPTDSLMQYAILDDMLLFSNIATTYSSRYGTNDPYTVGAISLKSSSLGQLLWMKNYSAPTTTANTIGVTRDLTVVDPVNRVMIFRDKETLVWQAYSIDDGSFVWTSKPIANVPDWEYFSVGGSNAYGNLYYSGYGGMLYCYDTKNGSLLWTYGNGGAGNSTFSGEATSWGNYPLTIRLISDGKIYLDTSEHSPNAPNYKGSLLRCIDAFTGKEIWTIMDYGGAPVAVADGFLTFYNDYDGQVYCVGKGPSATTVTAPDIAITQGSSLVIRGTVTDVSAGTKQNEQAARFPNGVPAMSDESQSAWMEYVYMQKPKPTNATGVPVSIDVVDANGNYRNIGTTTSDASGMFSYQWTPDITGKYTVVATFAGSESYWSSYSETSFAVDPAAPTASPYPVTLLPPTEMYFAASTVAIIVAIAIVGLLLLRKRP